MATYTGVGGSITFAAGTVLNVIEWSVTINQKNIKHWIMATADDFCTTHQSVRDWGGSFTCYLDDNTSPVIWSASVNIAPSSATFTSMTGKNIGGSIILGNLGERVVVDGDAIVSYTFEGSGTPTIT